MFDISFSTSVKFEFELNFLLPEADELVPFLLRLGVLVGAGSGTTCTTLLISITLLQLFDGADSLDHDFLSDKFAFIFIL